MNLLVTGRAAPVTRARAVVATLVTLLVGAGLELAVYGNGGHDALSDLPGRYFHWHLDTGLLHLGRPIEYPVVVGYVSTVTAWFGRGAAGFLLANGALSAGLAVLMTLVLLPRGGARIWRWAAGVPLALYAFHNWDLVALVPAVAGLVAFDRGKDRAGGALLALGASAKVFPGLFVVPLALVRWHSGDRRGAARLAGAFVVVAVALNLPVAATSWSAWTYPLRFQGARSATWGSLWLWAFRTPGIHALVGGNSKDLANALAMVVTVAGLAVVSVLAVRRRLDAFAIGAAVTGVFLLANKIYSPGYDLWIVPFFVLLPVGRRVWTAFWVSDLAIFTLVFGFLHGQWSAAAVNAMLPALVLVRAVTIVAVILTALQVRWPFAPPEHVPREILARS